MSNLKKRTYLESAYTAGNISIETPEVAKSILDSIKKTLDTDLKSTLEAAANLRASKAGMFQQGRTINVSQTLTRSNRI